MILAAVAVCALAAGALSFAAFRADSIEVSVREGGPDGTDIAFTVPAAMVEAAVRLLPAEACRAASAEIGEWLPVLQAVQEELSDLPDCELVKVTTDDERVWIAKQDRRLIIEIETDDEDVRVAMPVRFLSVAVAKLAKASHS
jgi:hypothetical protein